jgi:hypothetical protein
MRAPGSTLLSHLLRSDVNKYHRRHYAAGRIYYLKGVIEFATRIGSLYYRDLDAELKHDTQRSIALDNQVFYQGRQIFAQYRFNQFQLKISPLKIRQ